MKKGNRDSQYLSLLENKYRLFRTSVSNCDRKIGLELEFHVVPFTGEKPDFKLLNSILNDLLPELGFVKTDFDYNNNCVKGMKDRCVISFEVFPAILELSMGPFANLHFASEQIFPLIKIIEEFLKKRGLFLLPLGINPFPWALELSYMRTRYYQTLRNLFHDFGYKKKYGFENTVSFICANQVHIDVGLLELPLFLNAVNRLAWVKALLFANSPDILMKSSCLCTRDLLWRDSAFAYCPTNVGVVDKSYGSWQDVFLNTLENSIFYVIRDNKSIFFEPMPVRKFLGKKYIEGWRIDREKNVQVRVKVNSDDIQFSRVYNAAAITTSGTVEIRSECEQPFPDILSVAAFHLGLVCNLDKISNFLTTAAGITTDEHKWSLLREKAIFCGYNVQKKFSLDIVYLIEELLLLVREGIALRNNNEEIYLNCLFDRLFAQSIPAKEWVNKVNDGIPLIEVAREYGMIKKPF